MRMGVPVTVHSGRGRRGRRLLAMAIGAACLALPALAVSARYFLGASGQGAAGVARWEVAFQAGGEPLGQGFSLTFTPQGGDNGDVAPGTVAPGGEYVSQLGLGLSGTEVAVDACVTADTSGLPDGARLSLSGPSGEPLGFGGDVHIPAGAGDFLFNFTLSLGDGGDAADTALSGSPVEVPVSVRVRQHTGEGTCGDGLASMGLDYRDGRETVPRAVPAASYDAGAQDALYRNPGRGFYSTSNLKLLPGGKADGWTATSSGTSGMLYLKVDLSAFSGSMNGTGEDLGLTDKALSALSQALGDIRQSGCTAALRFVYDGGASGVIPGVAKTEPPQGMLLTHIRQLGPVFREYGDVVDVIQVGFYGLWGEAFYNTDAASRPDYYRETLGALLEATEGTEITVAARTPKYLSWYLGEDIGSFGAGGPFPEPGSAACRLGVFNDAYGGSSTDLGTYVGRAKETAWLGVQALHTYYGGEAIVDTSSPGASGGVGPYNDGNAFIREARAIHPSYLNWEWNQAIHGAWAGQPYVPGEGDPEGGAWEGASCLEYIEAHLGYRFVLTESRLPGGSVAPGGTLPGELEVSNTGFGCLIKAKACQLVLSGGDGREAWHSGDLSVDLRDALPGSGARFAFQAALPKGLAPGTYRVYLRVSSGTVLDGGQHYGAIRFANKGLWEDGLQANYIGDVEVG